MSKYWESRKVENFRQTHGLRPHVSSSSSVRCVPASLRERERDKRQTYAVLLGKKRKKDLLIHCRSILTNRLGIEKDSYNVRIRVEEIIITRLAYETLKEWLKRKK